MLWLFTLFSLCSHPALSCFPRWLNTDSIIQTSSGFQAVWAGGCRCLESRRGEVRGASPLSASPSHCSSDSCCFLYSQCSHWEIPFECLQPSRVQETHALLALTEQELTGPGSTSPSWPLTLRSSQQITPSLSSLQFTSVRMPCLLLTLGLIRHLCNSLDAKGKMKKCTLLPVMLSLSSLKLPQDPQRVTAAEGGGQWGPCVSNKVRKQMAVKCV